MDDLLLFGAVALQLGALGLFGWRTWLARAATYPLEAASRKQRREAGRWCRRGVLPDGPLQPLVVMTAERQHARAWLLPWIVALLLQSAAVSYTSRDIRPAFVVSDAIVVAVGLFVALQAIHSTRLLSALE